MSNEIILLNRVRVDIGNVSGPLSELMQYATLKGFNDNYEPQEKPRLVGTWTINYWYTQEQLAQARNTFDGLTIVENNEFLIDVNNSTVQTVDSTQPNYNPAVCIILEQAGYGSYMDDNDKTKGWVLTNKQASLITSINNFKNNVNVNDVNGICGTIGTTYPFVSFNEFSAFTGLTSIPTEMFSGCSNLEQITLPDSVTSIGYGLAYGTKISSFVVPLSQKIIGQQTPGWSTIRYYEMHSQVTQIAANAFAYLNNLTMVIKAVTPPSTDSNLWMNCSYNTFKIYVPDESLNAYKSAANWSAHPELFYPISELNNE